MIRRLGYFALGLLIVSALATQNALNLHGAINLTPDKLGLIAAVIVLGVIAIADRRAFAVVILILIAIAIGVTYLRGGKMPWQP